MCIYVYTNIAIESQNVHTNNRSEIYLEKFVGVISLWILTEGQNLLHCP